MTYKSAYEKAKKEKQLHDLTPKFVEFKEAGACVIGKFIDSVEVSSGSGEGFYNQYLFETDEGLTKFALGGATDKELQTTMKPGGVYYIEFKAKVSLAGGKSVNKFQVYEITPPAPGVEKPAEDVPF